MENKNIIIVLILIAAALALIAFSSAFNLFDEYKNVDESYVAAPIGGEKVRFTGTYLGPDDSMYNINQVEGVMQVGNSYVIINTDQVEGLEGQDVTVEGYFVNDKTESSTVPIDGKYVNGENFCIENVV